MIEMYRKAPPALCKQCEGNHSAVCGCLTDTSISNNFTSILMEVKSQEEFVRWLPKHAHDVHEWEGGRCDYHPLGVCTCNKCPTKEIKCEGKLLQVCTCSKCPIKETKCRTKLDRSWIVNSMLCCTRLSAWGELHRQAD